MVIAAAPSEKLFQVRRPVLPRPFVFAPNVHGPGDWPCELGDHLRGRTLHSPFDYGAMKCPYGMPGDTTRLRVKDASMQRKRQMIDARVVSVLCEHSPGQAAVWVLTLERL
jgi:hypothetical protein